MRDDLDSNRQGNDAPNPIPVTAESVAYLNFLPLAIKYGCDTRDSLAWFRFGIRLRRAAHLLARVYPLPSIAATDADQRTFVSESVNTLLSADASTFATLDSGERAIIAATQSILRT
jgi:hypothetical protein